MAAIQRTRLSSFGVGVFTAAVGAALLAGASGGYVVRALTSHSSAPAQSVQYRPAAADSEDIAQSDLTRAQPAPELPAWVQKYEAPVTAPQFKVDQMIESLGYAAAATTKDEAPIPAEGLQP
jgi:hypothetical protein